MGKLVVGIFIVAGVATLGDYLWFEIGVQHRMTNGLLHGAALLMAAGGALGFPRGRTAAGMGVGIAAGVLGALTYYALVNVMGQPAMFVAWVAVWLLLAIGEGRVVQRPPRAWSRIVASGGVAAVLSGVAFYAISGTVWDHVPPGTRNYGKQFACWLIAWAPGLIAIGSAPRGSH